jgi:hypothetical protein
MNLKELSFTPKNITKGIDLIRRMKGLKTITVGYRAGYAGAPDVFPSAEFWKKYDAGEFGKPVSARVPADRKPITTFNDPAFQKWMKEVAALPAEKQVEAVAKKLQELNPGFDGKVMGVSGGTPQIESGVVTQFGVITDTLTDISPVRALQQLKALACWGPFAWGKVSDLSPLKGMPLTYLRCINTRVYDLSPLKGMSLTGLECMVTLVSDLSPLKGMPLTKLNFSATAVSDLLPLREMPLEDLAFHRTPVSDLSPLNGMFLDRLDCIETQVSDLSPLEGMNLTELCFTPKNVTKGIDVIRRMKTLKTIAVGYEDKHKFPPAEFWKKYDAGEFGK